MYTEVLETQGIKIPYVRDVISDRMAEVIRKGRYESSEIKLLRKILRPRDRVLELGAGVGAVSAAAAEVVGPQDVLAIEANPGLMPVIAETHRLNGVEGVEVVNGVGVSSPTDEFMTFWLREHFWASSLAPLKSDDHNTKKIQVPQIDLNSIIKERAPTVLVMDIEGGELELLPSLDMSSCRHVVIELHPRVYDLAGVDRCFNALSRQGLVYDAKRSRGGTVVVFSRETSKPKSPTRVTAVTCMKDEAPFILEWIAFHKNVGITDFLIFTNDCSDGTIGLLDRLDEMGVVRHLPNYSTVIASSRHQPRALRYAPMHKEYRNADWVISMDVDEFINVHIGDRTLEALFSANQTANVISLSHLDFGCSGIEKFEDRFVTEQMTSCAKKQPESRKRRGIKTLIHKSAPHYAFSNHRPKFQDPDDPAIHWVDGSGRTFSKNHRRGEHKGMSPVGAYEQVQLNHYPLRSLETYLTKASKGNAVAIDSYVGLDYFEKRNGSDQIDETILPLLAKAKDKFCELIADPEVNRLHQEAVSRHIAKISELRKQADMEELLTKIRNSHNAARRDESVE